MALHTGINERAYLATRFCALVVTAAFVAAARVWLADRVSMTPAALGLFVFIVSSAGFLVARHKLRQPMEFILLWVAPFDLLATGLLGYAFHGFEDPMYATLLLVPVFYGLVLKRRDALALSLAAALVYLLQHLPYLGAADLVLVGMHVIKALLIVYIGVIVSSAATRQAERESQIVQSRHEKEQLNDQLQRRLGELQAVSQITEIIHSSLDFDRVGPLVLEVLTKVINVPACCLFVIDKRKAETLFSASVGLGSEPPPAPSVAGIGETLEIADSHFTCMSVVDHHQMMVVFCADALVTESMSDEDQLVMQAIASELVVAVENSQLYKLTKRLAITDELTSLFNYRYLQQRLDEEIERAKRYHKDLSLLMLDVDGFKNFNDLHGHIAGDVALSDLGGVLRRCVREVDVVCRYGGEEFSVALPETDAAGAFVVAEKIREAIATFLFADADGERHDHLTVSVGLATFPSHADDKEALLRKADDALYQAKNGGKDRVRSPVLRPNPIPGSLQG